MQHIERLLEIRRPLDHLLPQEESLFHPLWEDLTSLPRLARGAVIERGINSSKQVKQEEALLPSVEPVSGVVSTMAEFEPYLITAPTMLMLDSQQQQETSKLPWGQAKVLVRVTAPSSRLPGQEESPLPRWPLVAALDETGLICTADCYALWPPTDLPVEVLTAILNGPVANAFIAAHRPLDGNYAQVLRDLPLPRLSSQLKFQIRSLVHKYRTARSNWLQQPDKAQEWKATCEGILGRLEEEILGGYKLSIQREKELVKHFAGHKRPGPLPLTHIEPSMQNRLYRSLIRVEDVKNEQGKKIIDVVILGCEHNNPINLPASLVPQEVQEKIAPNAYLLANVNIDTKYARDLLFEDIQLVPAVTEDLRERFRSFAFVNHS